jgi:hypothetical protein
MELGSGNQQCENALNLAVMLCLSAVMDLYTLI